MSHARTQIQDAMVSALGLGVSIPVQAGRVYTLQQPELPLVGVCTNEELMSLNDGDGASFDAIGRELELICEVVAQGADGVTVNDSLNNVAVEIETTMGDERNVLGIIDCVPSAWSVEMSAEGETVTGKAIMGFNVLYRTAIGSPENII